MDRRVSIGILLAFTVVVIACVTASSEASATPLYTVRMEQASSKMNFLPTEKNTFAYITEQGYTVNYGAATYCSSAGTLSTSSRETCYGYGTCEGFFTCSQTCYAYTHGGETCLTTCYNMWTCTPYTCSMTCGSYTCVAVFTCMGTCVQTCPETCDTCQGWTCDATGCQNTCWSTCVYTCPLTCDTCEDTCEETCEYSTCDETCHGATCWDTCSGPEC